jgi:hypothetical protein
MTRHSNDVKILLGKEKAKIWREGTYRRSLVKRSLHLNNIGKKVWILEQQKP